MGGLEFEYEGKTYNMIGEGGCLFFDNDDEEEAFEKWRETPQGIQLYGPVPIDWSREHCIDDRYPWNDEKGCRVDVENPDDDDPYIDWCFYEKCRYGCYRHFYVTSDSRNCSACDVFACKQCAEGSFRKTSNDGGEWWICADCHKAETAKKERAKRTKPQGEEESYQTPKKIKT